VGARKVKHVFENEVFFTKKLQSAPHIDGLHVGVRVNSGSSADLALVLEGFPKISAHHVVVLKGSREGAETRGLGVRKRVGWR
jgi:hypothetical protein